MRSHRDVYFPYFNAAERQLIYSAMEEAAEHLRRYYCFSAREWFNHCYDLKTAVEVHPVAYGAAALAEVRKYTSPFSNLSPFPKERYHVCLFDGNILQALWKQSGLEFYPFMVYILTHELVHVARFCQDFHPFECDERGVEKEEEKVNRLTQKVLEVKKNRTFHKISCFYDKVTKSTTPVPSSVFL